MTEETFNYFALVRKSDNKEVYSSPDYREGVMSEIFAFDKIICALNYYFQRVNSGIEQQLNSPKLTDEQKKELKLLDKSDYLVKYLAHKELGCRFQKTYWTKEAKEFLKDA